MMTRKPSRWPVALAMAALSCGGSKQPGAASGAASDASAGGGDGPASAGLNVAPVLVSAGPPGIGSIDVPFLSVTLCAPGTKNCKTIDYVSVDTGSSGVRILSSALSGGLMLPQQTASTGSSLAECFAFADGYTWGSVRLADVTIAGETAAKIPIHLIGDPAFGSVPADCSSTGPSEDTVETFGGNGIIGINQIVPDCGDFCAATNPVQSGVYYSCGTGTCAPVAVATADQVSNPIASFATDNNGAVLEFPTVAPAGAPTLGGTLTFGIGTQGNNALGGAAVQTVDAYGNFTTIYKGATLATSFIDSGSNSLGFDDSSIADCSSPLVGFFCPASTLSLTAQNKGRNGVTTTVMFSVGNAQTLLGNSSDAAFDDVAGPGLDSNTFDWGLPFFMGRTVYVALDGATTSGGKGPYFAY